MQYLEFLDLLVDEQNGFRKNQSCADHIYALTSAVQNRLSVDQRTFTAFIDFQKAFDWVDRDLLFYKLLWQNYQAIKALYDKTSSCVKLMSTYTDWFLHKHGGETGRCNITNAVFNFYQ